MRRHRNHKAYWAFLGHRISGLALAIFLPFHFYVLGLALGGADSLDRFLAIGENQWVKAAEWGLISLLTLHFCFGLRLLFLEFFAWPSHRQARLNWIMGGLAATVVIGFVFLLQVS